MLTLLRFNIRLMSKVERRNLFGFLLLSGNETSTDHGKKVGNHAPHARIDRELVEPLCVPVDPSPILHR
jgi:hypothetical protein